MMSDTVVETLILDLLEWLAKRERTYDETIDAWRTSCPKLAIWEDANDLGFVALDVTEEETNIVRITSAGRAFLQQQRVSQLLRRSSKANAAEM